MMKKTCYLRSELNEETYLGTIKKRATKEVIVVIIEIHINKDNLI